MVLGRLEDASHSGREWRARCPAHDDEKPSLNLRAGDRQPVVITCRAGCPPTDVLAAIGLTFADVSHEHGDQPPGAGKWTPSGPAVAVYDYTDAKAGCCTRCSEPSARTSGSAAPIPRRKPGGGGNSATLAASLTGCPGCSPPPANRTPSRSSPRASATCRRSRPPGGIATCNPGGAGNWRDAYSKHLAGFAEVIIIADKDEAGRKHAAKVAASLTKAGVPKFRIVEAAEGKDAADHLAKGHGLHDFVTAAAPASESRRIPRPSASAADPLPDEPLTELGYAHRLVQRLRRPAPVRARMAALARLGRPAVGPRRYRPGPAVDESHRPRLTTDAMAIEDEKERKAAISLARRGESAHAVAGALTLAGTETGIVVTPDDLDADPFLLNCANGTARPADRRTAAATTRPTCSPR